MPSEGSTTITETSLHRSAAGAPELTLVWTYPRPDHPGVSLHWDGPGDLVLGRDEASAVRLSGDGVSRRHALLRRDLVARTTSIVDLDSRNGVRVNGRLVRSALLGAGDVVRLGGWVAVVTATPGACAEIAPGLFGGLALVNALAPLRQAATSDLPIVLEGETGTGKEVATRSLHAWSGRAGPLIAVNCASLPEGLAEAELFGYRRGAFTGADRPSPGFFRSAEGGTLLLDEVSDLPLPLQAKLLRVLEQREVQPLGETRPVPVDVRIVVAGQAPLRGVVREGRFRPDLLARLEGVTIRLPPLRERREDVLALFMHLLSERGQRGVPAVEAEFVERLTAHDWPFNVRELVLLVRRLLVLHPNETTLRSAHLPEGMGSPGSLEVAADPKTEQAGPGASQPAAERGPTRPVELPALIAALRASGGNVARASAMLGITRQRAYRLMEGNAVDLEALRNDDVGP